MLVLTLGEAAAKLGVTRAELQAMVAAGQIETVPGEFDPCVLSREIERLKGG